MNEEQRNVLVQLLVHGFGLHAARQGLGELAEQGGFELLEGGIDAKQLLQTGAPWEKDGSFNDPLQGGASHPSFAVLLTPQRTLNPFSVHNL